MNKDSQVTPLLQVQKVSYGNKKTLLLKDIELNISLGESLGVIGPNGGGKSTLLKIMAGLLTPTAGGVLKKQDLITSYVGQEGIRSGIMPVTVREYIDMGHFHLHHCQGHVHYQASECMKRLHISHLANRPLWSLSGGERQRCHLAKAMLCAPHLLILDEPNNALDMQGQEDLLEWTNELVDAGKMALIIVDHNLTRIMQKCHKLLCLNKNQHWHNHKDQLSQEVLESIYNCEFEHQLLHQQGKSCK